MLAQRASVAGTIGVLVSLCFATTGMTANESEQPPYPRSPVIANITFDRTTWVKAAPGSDQFGCTWAKDGNLYAAWGDGGGFGGTNSRGRASLGVARIKGMPPRWHARNVANLGSGLDI